MHNKDHPPPQFERPFDPLTTKLTGRFETSKAALSTKELFAALESVQGTSREWIYEQYDQRVGTQTVRDCSWSVGVVKLPSHRGLAIALGGRPHMMRLESRLGGFDAAFEPSLQLAAKGFESIAATDCLNYGNPEEKQIMAEFVHSLAGLNDACKSLKMPIISGNVSFYNQTEGQNITSTPSVGVVGLKDSIHTPSQNFEAVGAPVFLVSQAQVKTQGLWSDLLNQNESGQGENWKPELWISFLNQIRELAQLPEVECTRVVGKFGLGYTLAKMIQPEIGFEASSEQDWKNEILYQVIFVLKKGSDQNAFEAKIINAQIEKIGMTTKGTFKISDITESCDSVINTYRTGWEKHFEELF